MKGYTGMLLRVNLTDGTMRKEALKDELLRDFIGGRGLNSKILYDEILPGTDPLGPGNKIIIGAGPCNGTPVPGSCRLTVSSKSPMTGLLGDSNAGGFFGAELKYAGYDAVIIEGRSDRPVYLFIDDDRVALMPAEHLWGLTTRETMRAIRRENLDPDIYTISLGPAGERLVRFGNLISDLGRGLGRTGQGAVFGSKKLKAVAVRGTKGVEAADPAALTEAVREIYASWTPGPDKDAGLNALIEVRARYGPAGGWPRYANNGMFATRNFQGGAEWIDMRAPLDNYFLKQKACFSCPAGCDHLYVISEGPYAGTYGEGLELTTVNFGPLMGNEDMDLVAKLHALLDEYGLDYFETADLVAFCTECFEKGILTREDTGGLELAWGKAESALGLVEQIVRREGLGDILAEGVKRASELIGRGAERYAMQAKGQTLVGRDVRASKGWGLAYAVASRGPCHIRASLPEGYTANSWDASVQPILKKYKDPTNPLLEEGKAELVQWHENLTAFKNSMNLCLFTLYPHNVRSGSQPEMLARLYSAVTGMPMDQEEVLRTGERIINIERAFNIREGLTRKDDTLPERMLKEPYPDGPAKGQVVNLEPMLDDYYRFRGWDKATGFPARAKLLELRLADVALDLEKMGKLVP